MNVKVNWPDPTLPAAICCLPGVLTGLEMIAADGLVAMPRTGLGIGGLLLGKRAKSGVEIERAIPVDCSHALGPAFVLTAEEIAARPGSGDSEGDSEVVGWFCSKPNLSRTAGTLTLTAHDQLLFDAWCPEAWQVALLIRPSMGNATTGAFGMRRNGTVKLGAALELAWQELAAFEVAPVETAPVESQAPPPFAMAAAAGATTAGSPIAQMTPEPEQVLRRLPRSGTLFGVPEIPPEVEVKPRRWPLRLLLTLIALALVALAGFLTRDYWVPKPPVAMTATSDWKGTVSILWNSEAFADRDHASLIIEDGKGPLHTIYLNDKAVRAGWYVWECRSGSMTATLLAGPISDSVTVKARTETYRPESGISK